MNLQVDIQRASAEPAPTDDQIRGWIEATLQNLARTEPAEICVRVVDNEEISNLNATYRNKPGPTNVLAFTSELPAGVNSALLGDIVICAPVVRAEALEQEKDLNAHWAHMTIHGTLHLLGLDHIREEDALIMETIESTILSGLNYSCPYENDLIAEDSHS